MEESTVFYVREAVVSYGPRKRPAAPKIAASNDAVRLECLAALRDVPVEHFVAVACDSRNRPVAWSTIAIGSIAACPVNPCDVLRFAILSGAPALIVAHNHPSGDPTPSAEDVTLTKRLADACRVVGIRLLDHLVIAETSHFSFLDAGLLSAVAS